LLADGLERTRRLGRAIRAARADLTQAALATRLGVSQPAISAWESGSARIDLEKLLAIELELGLELGSLAAAAGYRSGGSA
jgi:transcriptional regulator with XRE-family HTH domain